ncbi:MAG: GNAT family acetyltransferase [Desulfatibacillum sp.]|nr:GNAT family acetyltransferase [Desulfatibacillum sp.]
MFILEFRSIDQEETIALWKECGLISPANNPAEDIRRKQEHSPGLFWVGKLENRVVATCMAGYDGHRGWIYYLAVTFGLRRQGLAKRIVSHAENALLSLGCPKINLMVRKSNGDVLDFYRKIGYQTDSVLVLSKRLFEDKV